MGIIVESSLKTFDFFLIYFFFRRKYYKYLKLANKGDLRPFVRFIAYSTDETLNTYLGGSQFLIHHVESPPVIQMNQNRNV